MITASKVVNVRNVSEGMRTRCPFLNTCEPAPTAPPVPAPIAAPPPPPPPASAPMIAPTAPAATAVLAVRAPRELLRSVTLAVCTGTILPSTAKESSWTASSVLPVSFPESFSATNPTVASAPFGAKMTSPSLIGLSRLALNSLPALFFSESMESISRMVISVPAGGFPKNLRS